MKNTAQCRNQPDNQITSLPVDQLEAFIDSFFDFFCVLSPDGHFKQVNTAFMNVLGYSENELLLKQLSTFVHPEELQLVLDGMKHLSKTRPSLRLECRIKCKDDTYRWLRWVYRFMNESGDIFAVARDITIEKELEKAHKQTQAILETTVDGIITINERGDIQSFNLAAEKIFGYKAEDVIGQNVKILMPEPFHGEHDGYLQNYLETRHRKIIGIGREVIGRRKNGSIFPMELAVSEIPLGKQKLFTGLVRDIGERRRMELEILQISEFERQNIGQELHDGLGSHLSGIGMICQIVAKKLTKAEHPMASEVNGIAEQIKNADYLARNIARGLVPVAPNPSGLKQALQRLVETTESAYGITCSFESDGDVLIDDTAVSVHLYRIAQESCSNAVRHGKPTEIKISLKAHREGVTLEVLDNGLGIPEEVPEGRGVGLRTMQYRSNVIGARLSIGQGPEGGTIVSCRTQYKKTGETPISLDASR